MSHREFQYFISNNGPIITVNFMGRINDKNMHLLDSCLEQLLDYNPQQVIFNFKQLHHVSNVCIGTLGRFFDDIRSQAKVSICSLEGPSLELLSQGGFIRDHELKPNLNEALSNYIYSNKRFAA